MGRWMVLKLDWSGCYYEGDTPEIISLGTISAKNEQEAHDIASKMRGGYGATLIEIGLDPNVVMM